MYTGFFGEGHSKFQINPFDPGRIRTARGSLAKARYRYGTVSMGSNTQRAIRAQYLSVTSKPIKSTASHPRSKLSMQGGIRQGRPATLNPENIISHSLSGSKSRSKSRQIFAVDVTGTLGICTASIGLFQYPAAFPRGCLCRTAGACTDVGVRYCTIVSESGLSDKRQDAECLPSLSRLIVKPPRSTARFFFSKSLIQMAFPLTASEPFLIHSIVGLCASLLSSFRFQLRDLAFQRIFLRYES